MESINVLTTPCWARYRLVDPQPLVCQGQYLESGKGSKGVGKAQGLLQPSWKTSPLGTNRPGHILLLVADAVSISGSPVFCSFTFTLCKWSRLGCFPTGPLVCTTELLLHYSTVTALGLCVLSACRIILHLLTGLHRV